MKDTIELKKLTVDELQTELLSLRKDQFTLRMKKANGSLDKTHLITLVRKAIARVKTIMTEKAGTSHVK
jgi:large subunit ribosomal protein L29